LGAAELEMVLDESQWREEGGKARTACSSSSDEDEQASILMLLLVEGREPSTIETDSQQ